MLQKIKECNPTIVYLSGKTSTGKTTFANELKLHGYTQIELDRIVTNSVVNPFKVSPEADAFITAYRGGGPVEQVSAFVEAVKKEINEKATSSPIVIDGAIAKSLILKEIFSGELENFFFIYFHPIHLDVYTGRIEERFVAGAKNSTSGLPKYFWNLVHEKDLGDFLETSIVNDGIKNSIRRYAKLSMEESGERLAHFKESFPDIHVVEF